MTILLIMALKFIALFIFNQTFHIKINFPPL